LHDTADALAAAAGLFADVDMVGRKALPMASVQLGICHLDMTRIALGIEQGRYEPISIELGPFEFRLGAVVLGRIGSCGVRIGSASIDLPDHFTVLSNRAAKSAPAPIKIKGAMSAFGADIGGCAALVRRKSGHRVPRCRAAATQLNMHSWGGR
jgi:hypothetical protein